MAACQRRPSPTDGRFRPFPLDPNILPHEPHGAGLISQSSSCRSAPSKFSSPMAIDGEDEMSCNGHDTSLDSLDVLHKHLKEPLLKNLSDPPVPASWKRRLKPLQKYMKDHDQSPVTWLGLAMFFGILCGLVCFVYAHWFRALLWLVWQVSAS